MKKNILMASALMCAFAAATTGCNNDELNENTPVGKQFTITAITPNNGADTRVGYDDTDATKVKLTWNAGDAIGVWKADATTVNEFTTDKAGASANFTGSADFTNGDQLYAVYPKPTSVNNNEVTLNLSTAQSGTLSDSYQYMYASASAKDKTASFNFEHAVSVLKLTLKGEFTSLTSLTLNGTNLFNKATLSMSTSNVTGSKEGIISAAGPFAKDAIVYLYLFPGTPTNLTLTGFDGAKMYQASLPNRDSGIAAGKVYTAEVTMTKAIEWAAGNLVASGENGVKNGTATDGGLYFQFGSLIGWSGGATGDGTGTAVNGLALEIKVKLAAFEGVEDWTATGKIWQGTEGTVPFTVAGSGSDDEKAGIGDPCRYYLGDTWRLPTVDEYKALFNYVTDNKYASSGGWSWDDASKSATHTNGLTFPASGYRNASVGSLSSVGTYGYYWSASPNVASNGYSLGFNSSLVLPSISNNRALGCLCVVSKKSSNLFATIRLI